MDRTNDTTSLTRTATTSEPSSIPTGAPDVSPGPSANAVPPSVRTHTNSVSPSSFLIDASPFCEDGRAQSIVTLFLPDLCPKAYRATRLFSEGDFGESRRLFNELLIETKGAHRVYVSNQLAKIERAENQTERALSIHLLTELLVIELNHHYSSGNWSAGMGNTRRLQGDAENAWLHYQTALSHFAAINDYADYAQVENNIGFLLTSEKRADEALSHLETARELFVSLGLPIEIARVDDTLALAHLQLGNTRAANHFNHLSLSALIGTNERAAIEQAFKTQELIKRKILEGEEC